MTSPHAPRKRFGQNFLTNEHVIEQIVLALNPKVTDTLVEIGPGLGALTKLVLKKIAHLQVVEIDRDLSQRLRTDYPDTITIHEADGLKFDYRQCLQTNSKIRVFGNLPYNISTPLLFHLLRFGDIIQDMLFMLQKEVVMRMKAKTNEDEYGRLSIMVQYHCEVKRLFDVDKSAFSPQPKVTSSIVSLKPYSQVPPHPLATDYNLFAQLVNLAFQHRRKTLKNSVGHVVPVEIYERVGIDPIRRPETLSIGDFVNISNALHALRNTPKQG